MNNNLYVPTSSRIHQILDDQVPHYTNTLNTDRQLLEPIFKQDALKAKGPDPYYQQIKKKEIKSVSPLSLPLKSQPKFLQD